MRPKSASKDRSLAEISTSYCGRTSRVVDDLIGLRPSVLSAVFPKD